MLKNFDRNADTPELIWDASMRSELRSVLGAKLDSVLEQRQESGELFADAKIVPDFVAKYPRLNDELYIGGVYVSSFVKDPTYSLRDPTTFLELLLHRWTKEIEVFTLERISSVKATETTLTTPSQDVLELVTTAIVFICKLRDSLCDKLASWGYMSRSVAFMERLLERDITGTPLLAVIRLLHVASSRLVNVEALALIGHSDGRQGVVEFTLKAIGNEALHPDCAFMIEFLKKAYTVALGDLDKAHSQAIPTHTMPQPSFGLLAPSPVSGDGPVRKKVSVGDDPLGMMQPLPQAPLPSQQQAGASNSVGNGSSFQSSSVNLLQAARTEPLSFQQRSQVPQQTPLGSYSSGPSPGIIAQGNFPTPLTSQPLYASPQHHQYSTAQQQHTTMSQQQQYGSPPQNVQSQNQPYSTMPQQAHTQQLYTATPPQQVHPQYSAVPLPQPQYVAVQQTQQQYANVQSQQTQYGALPPQQQYSATRQVPQYPAPLRQRQHFASSHQSQYSATPQQHLHHQYSAIQSQQPHQHHSSQSQQPHYPVGQPQQPQQQQSLQSQQPQQLYSAQPPQPAGQPLQHHQQYGVGQSLLQPPTQYSTQSQPHHQQYGAGPPQQPPQQYSMMQSQPPQYAGMQPPQPQSAGMSQPPQSLAEPPHAHPQDASIQPPAGYGGMPPVESMNAPYQSTDGTLAHPVDATAPAESSYAAPRSYKPTPIVSTVGMVDARSAVDPHVVAAQQTRTQAGAPQAALGRVAWLQQALATKLCAFLIESVLEHPQRASVRDPAAAQVHSIALIQLLRRDPGFGYQFTLLLQEIPAWKKYQSQDHSLLITGPEQRVDYFLTDGSSSGAAALQRLTER
jgi:hypothetical protein